MTRCLRSQQNTRTPTWRLWTRWAFAPVIVASWSLQVLSSALSFVLTKGSTTAAGGKGQPPPNKGPDEEAMMKLRTTLTEAARLRTARENLEHDLDKLLETQVAHVRDVAALNDDLTKRVHDMGSKLADATKEKEKLQRQLEDAENERVCVTTRLRQEVEGLETRLHELEEQLQQYGAHYQQQQNSEHGGTAPTGATDGAALPPAGPSLSDKRVAPSPRAQLLPPVLHLDPAEFLLEADLDVGFTRADIQTELHQFASAVSWLCRLENVQSMAFGLAAFSKEALIPEGSAGAHPSIDAVLAAERPACLAHLLMYWMSTTVWADPLKYLLGCNRLGLLETLPARGPPEQNLLILLRSHAARQWLHSLRSVVQEALDADRHEDWQGRWKDRLVRRSKQQQDKAANAAVSGLNAMTEELAGWLGSVPVFAGAVRTVPVFHALLLRALKLGLMVMASHPLLRLYVTMPRSEDPEKRWIPLNCHTQEALRRELFVPQKNNSNAKQTGTNISFVLCSLQPGVRYDTQAATQAGGPAPVGKNAGAVHDTGNQEVLVKEEVVTWEWAQDAKGH